VRLFVKNKDRDALITRERKYSQRAVKRNTEPRDIIGLFVPMQEKVISDNEHFGSTVPLETQKLPNPNNAAKISNESVFKAYLDQQGRNEYINLAAQIGYNGTNITFVFFENQIRKLMNEGPCDERKLKVLRAACTGQPRELVNLFLAPMKSISTRNVLKRHLTG